MNNKSETEMSEQPQRLQTTLGKTGLTCSLAGLGCGGASRLGLRKGRSMEQAADVVRFALDQGISFIDTSRLYGTEPAVGMALKDRKREDLVLSTKVLPLTEDNEVDPHYVQEQIDDSLKKLGVETIDFVSLHGVLPQDYDRVFDTYLGVLERARSEGKIRFLGTSEFWNDDLDHSTLRRAIADGHLDALLVGCNMINSSARRTVLPKAQEKGMAIFLMFAVRRTLADPEALKAICKGLVAQGEIDPDSIDLKDPLGFLVREGGASSVTEAAYRYCHYLPGVSVVLTGSSEPNHLVDNIQSIEAPPLPDEIVERVDNIFKGVKSTTGEI